MTTRRVAIVGGGVTGLAAAYALRDLADVTVFEASDRLGGLIRTDDLDGTPIELGPDSLLARDEQPVELLREIGLGNDIVEPHGFGAWISDRDRLRRIPEGFVLGVPTRTTAIARSGLLSPIGSLRAALDLVRPRTQTDGDVALGTLVRARFGNEVADRVVAPLMTGIRAGDIDEMSAEMAAPEVLAAARKKRSLMLGLRANAPRARPRFIGLRRGMSSLVTALEGACSAEVRLSTAVTSLRPGPRVEVDGEKFDGAIVAVPPPVAGSLLDREELTSVRFTETEVMNLLYEPGAVPPLKNGTGVLFAPDNPSGLIACTWYTQKWPHLARSDGATILRCVARTGTALAAVVPELSKLGVTGEPKASRVQIWDRALPVFEVGHRRRMEAVDSALAGYPLRLAGAGHLATGLNDCLAQGRSAATEVLAAIRS